MGRDYNVQLDTGMTVRMDERDMIPLTPDIEEAYRKQAEEFDRINRRTEERGKRIKEARCRYEEALEERDNKAAEEESQALRNKHDAIQQQHRKEKGREYGLRSLGR